MDCTKLKDYGTIQEYHKVRVYY